MISSPFPTHLEKLSSLGLHTSPWNVQASCMVLVMTPLSWLDQSCWEDSIKRWQIELVITWTKVESNSSKDTILLRWSFFFVFVIATHSHVQFIKTLTAVMIFCHFWDFFRFHKLYIWYGSSITNPYGKIQKRFKI